MPVPGQFPWSKCEYWTFIRDGGKAGTKQEVGGYLQTRGQRSWVRAVLIDQGRGYSLLIVTPVEVVVGVLPKSVGVSTERSTCGEKHHMW